MAKKSHKHTWELRWEHGQVTGRKCTGCKVEEDKDEAWRLRAHIRANNELYKRLRKEPR